MEILYVQRRRLDLTKDYFVATIFDQISAGIIIYTTQFGTIYMSDSNRSYEMFALVPPILRERERFHLPAWRVSPVDLRCPS